MEKTTDPDHPLASRFIDVNEMDWTPTELPGIDMKPFYKDEDAGHSTILFRMAPRCRVYRSTCIPMSSRPTCSKAVSCIATLGGSRDRPRCAARAEVPAILHCPKCTVSD